MDRVSDQRPVSSHQLRWRLLRGMAAVSAILAFSFPTAPAQAAPIEFHYGGVITSADDGTGITPGTRFDGTFTYDPQADPRAAMIENGHSYVFNDINYPGAANPAAQDTSALSLYLDGKLYKSQQGGLGLFVYEVQSNDRFDPVPRTQLNFSTRAGVELSLSNPARAVFGSLDIPTTINLADFPNATISETRWDADRGAYLTYKGTIDTLSQINITTTPEPGSVALWVGLAAGAWAVRARRRNG